MEVYMLSKSVFYDEMSCLLCPPGSGVYAVSNSANKKINVHSLIYGDVDSATDHWLSSLRSISEAPVCLLGICSDNGGGILRGANWGPLYLREYLLNLAIRPSYLDLGDVRVIPHLLHDKYLNHATLQSCRHALYANSSAPYPVSPLSITEHVLNSIYKEFPHQKVFSLGGDHSVSYPLVKTYLEHKRKQGIHAAVIHFDAHTDLLQERLGVDICFGSWCYHILDKLNSPQHLIQLGIRSSAKNKQYWLDKFGICQIWAEEFNLDSMCESLIQHLNELCVTELYISFDIDALDPEFAPCTGTPEPHGLHLQDCTSLIDQLAKHFKVTGADLVEVAPLTNSSENVGNARHKTLMSASVIASSLISALNQS
jgi:agmatinase